LTPKSTMFRPIGKKKELNTKFIIFIYKEYSLILLCFKMRKWISHLCRPLSSNFTLLPALENDVIWNVYSFFLHWHAFLRNQGLTSEVENKCLITHLDSGTEVEL
jgi:hypothetical protein